MKAIRLIGTQEEIDFFLEHGCPQNYGPTLYLTTRAPVGWSLNVDLTYSRWALFPTVLQQRIDTSPCVSGEEPALSIAKDSFLSWKASEYPGIDDGLLPFLEAANLDRQHFATMWSCVGHPEENEYDEGYVALVGTPKHLEALAYLLSLQVPDISDNDSCTSVELCRLQHYYGPPSNDVLIYPACIVRWKTNNPTKLNDQYVKSTKLILECLDKAELEIEQGVLS